MSQHKPEVGDLFEDQDARMNRRVRITEIVNPYGASRPVAVIENVGGWLPLENGVPAPSPIGKKSSVRVDRMARPSNWKWVGRA